MDYIPYGPTNPAWFLLIISGAIALSAGILLLIGVRTKRDWPYVASAITIAVAFLVVVAFLPTTSPVNAQKYAIAAEIRDTYDLSIGYVDDLEYPREKPTADLTVYGSTNIEGMRVTLIWTGGKMILGEVDSSDIEYRELKR